MALPVAKPTVLKSWEEVASIRWFLPYFHSAEMMTAAAAKMDPRQMGCCCSFARRQLVRSAQRAIVTSAAAGNRLRTQPVHLPPAARYRHRRKWLPPALAAKMGLEMGHRSLGSSNLARYCRGVHCHCCLVERQTEKAYRHPHSDSEEERSRRRHILHR